MNRLPARERPKVSYNSVSGDLWLWNGKPLYRSHDISESHVTVYFESEDPVPSALKISNALEWLFPFFSSPDGKVSERELVVFGEFNEQMVEAAVNQFLDPETKQSDSLVIVHKRSDHKGSEVLFEKFLNVENLEVFYESEGDILALGNGRPAPKGGHDIAEGLIVFFEEKGVPVYVEIFDAAELLGPVLEKAAASKSAGLI